MIEYFNNEINAFYKDMDFPVYDECVFYQNGKIKCNFKGAKEFSRRFLMGAKKQKKATGIQGRILEIIDSRASMTYLNMLFKTILNNEKITIKWDETTNKIFKNITTITDQKIIQKTGKHTVKNINKMLEEILVEKNKRKKGGYGVKLSSQYQKEYKKLDAYKDLLSDLGIEVGKEISLTNSKDLEIFQAAVKQQLRDKYLYKTIAEQYWDGFLRPSIERINSTLTEVATLKKDVISNKENVKQIFIDAFSNTLMGYRGIDFSDMSNQKSLNGFLLEFGTFVSFELPQATRGKVKLLGQNFIQQYRINQQYNEEGELVNTGIKGIYAENPSDISIQGKSGKVYKFQLKNTLQEKDILSFRAQAEIKYSSLVANAITDEKDRNMLTYLLLNIGFLNKEGLNTYKAGKQKELIYDKTNSSKNKNKEILDYTAMYLQLAYEFILSTKYRDNIDKLDSYARGNSAYIYQGKYFIPITAFFYSAYNLLLQVYQNKKASGIGGLKTPALDGFDGLDNKALQRKKIGVVNDRKTWEENEAKVFKYPQQLVDIGKQAGNQLYNQMRIKSIQMVLFINNIENLLR